MTLQLKLCRGWRKEQIAVTFSFCSFQPAGCVSIEIMSWSRGATEAASPHRLNSCLCCFLFYCFFSQSRYLSSVLFYDFSFFLPDVAFPLHQKCGAVRQLPGKLNTIRSLVVKIPSAVKMVEKDGRRSEGQITSVSYINLFSSVKNGKTQRSVLFLLRRRNFSFCFIRVPARMPWTNNAVNGR